MKKKCELVRLYDITTQNYQTHSISDDKMRVGDWVMKDEKMVFKIQDIFTSDCGLRTLVSCLGYEYSAGCCKPIIASTEKRFEFGDGLPLPNIPDEFVLGIDDKGTMDVMVEYAKSNGGVDMPVVDDKNCIIISPVKKEIYTREEVEKLCNEAFYYGFSLYGTIPCDLPTMLDVWFEENLN